MRRLIVLGVLTMMARNERISISQIEERLKSLRGEAKDSVEAQKTNVLAIGGGAVVALIAIAFLLGRRRGRKRSTVLEIRRV